MAAASDVFPFAAIVGQDDLKLALLLNAVSPKVGGVLIQGEKGNAKSTTVRALADLLPPIPVVPGCPYRCDPDMPFSFCPHCQGKPWKGEAVFSRPPFVELPLGATEDRLLGHPDLDALLARGEHRFHPGLLAQAHRGILYVDEVNLLDDQLVDNLLDAAASGWNRVEREGFSLVHPARFILVGTMNPEEGELRPQLKDRFGLAVQVTTPQDVEERIKITERRLAFNQDPETFCRQWREAQEETAHRIRLAQQLLPGVRLPRERLAEVAKLALSAGTEGMRADLVICEAAKALAAYSGRDEVTSDDVLQAARFALFHRARTPWKPDPGTPDQNGGSGEGRRDETDNGHSEAAADPATGRAGGRETASPVEHGASGASGHSETTADTDLDKEHGIKPAHQAGGEECREPGGGKDAPLSAFSEYVFPLEKWLSVQAAPLTGCDRPAKSHVERSGLGIASRGLKTAVEHPAKGRQSRTRPLDLGVREHGVRIDWTKSVYTAALRQSRPGAPRIRAEDVRQKVFRFRQRRLTFFLLDASGSMAGYRRMAQVKGAVLALAEAAYRRRDLIALAAFRDGRMDLLQPPTRSIAAVVEALEALATGGDTPLALGLNKSREWLLRWRKFRPQWRPHLILFSDGRVNGTSGTVVPGVPGAFAEVLEAARRLAANGISGAVVDTETGWFRFGGARWIAGAMQVPCYSLDELKRDEQSSEGRVVG